MYNGQGLPGSQPPYPPYPIQGDQPWTAGFGQDGIDSQQQSQQWYMNQGQAGPSTLQSGYEVPNLVAGPAVYHPRQTSISSTYTPPQATSNTTPDTNDQASLGSKTDKLVKKKRKKVTDGDAKEPSPDTEKEKRTKTGRACDACRTKKIRCDILSVETPEGETPICAHCKQYGLECTFFLPITETRFKKRKGTDMEETALPGISTRTDGDSHSPTYADATVKGPREVPVRLEGPTSLSFLLHTTLPASASEAYDLREHNKWEVSEDGNGLIRVYAPPTAMPFADGDPDDPTRAHNRLNRPVLSAQTISLLVNAYFDQLAPLFPIISRAEFAAKATPSPLLLYAICGLGATRRQFPREVFAGVRGVINGLLRSNDILSDARFENVQALLLLSQVGDLHAQPTAATASAALVRTGTATRMAQDLGLHRESTLRAQTAQDLVYVELRRRVWATCVILDRWYGAALGIPLLVDLLDCDVLLPAPYEINPDTEPGTWSIDPSYLGLTEHLKLAILMGRVLKTIYSPTGLKHATDAQLVDLLEDMNVWQDNLPEQLKFTGKTSSTIAGLLHLSYTALHFLFWRVFMRIQYTCPPHIHFRLRMANWNRMIQWSGESIEWLAVNDEALDSLFVFPYTATSCALIQYHTWARRRDQGALDMLRVIKETAVNWEKMVKPDQMSIRRKTCETMTLLYEAALKTNPDTVEDTKDRPPAVNPTPGVTARPDYGNAVWIKDETRPGGGCWVAATEEDCQASGVQYDVLLLHEMPQGPLRRLAEEKLRRGSEIQQSQRTKLEKDSDDAQQDVKDLHWRESNLNPQINGDGIVPAGGGTGVMASGIEGQVPCNTGVYNVDGTGLTQPRPLWPGDDGNPLSDWGVMPGVMPDANGVDFSLLDTLPTSGIDFPSWEVSRIFMT
ncbi:fungal-specific transcription factor domain-domain-containing protein [Naematelia encephala]|uniref:Fungal-specific transcription factor domain-domain-containing protein n=1 Tax=Naematelia encephala TaxID=71784 RepID=A0A1Y2B8R7_9TREE|nr:fungal-specific transcription factor domain-domain-containing protein [Naematelia encephala]